MIRRILSFMSQFVLIALLLGVLYAFAMFQGGVVSWFLFFSFLPISIYHFCLLVYPLKNWQVTREISSYMTEAGGYVDVELKIKRIIPFPIYYCVVEEVLPERLKTVVHRLDNDLGADRNFQVKKLVFPFFRRVIKVAYRLKDLPRGEHELRKVIIRTSDVFGFVKRETSFDVLSLFMIYPKEREVLLKKQAHSFGQAAISTAVLSGNQSNISTGVREYAAGDKLSWIDWKATAKQNMMMTKEFEREKSNDVLFVLDRCSYEDVNTAAFESAIEVLLSVITVLEKRDVHMDLLSIGKETIHFSSFNKKLIRQHLAKTYLSGNHSFVDRLDMEKQQLANRLAVIIVTTYIDEALTRKVQQLKKRTKAVIVYLVQSSIRISASEYERIEMLKQERVVVIIITEKELKESPLEVSI